MTATYYPALGDVVRLAEKVGAPVRDLGLVESALARPQTTVFGEDAYPDLWTKVAALLHSMVNNHPFIDGNKRMGWLAAITMLYQNGGVTSADIANADQDAAYDLVIAIAENRLLEVVDVAAALKRVFGH